MSFISNMFGGGGGAPAATPASQTQFIREAPGIEERKLEVMDIARQVAQKPINLPAMQVAGQGLGGALQQQGMTAAGTTGVGGTPVGQGISQILSSAAGPNINQFLNPYQSYVTDEITRQANIAQNQLGAQAVNYGAYGGGRQGVQAAEIERGRLGKIGEAMSTGFGQAANLATQQQQLGLQAGQQLGQMGLTQQQMGQADISQLMGAGGIQQQLAQQALDAQRQTTLQQQYEPYQRAEFLSNLYAAGPKSQSGITMTTTPGTSPLAQSIGTGLGAFTAYQAGQQPPR
tara:strand:+ start:70 stop:933 length:864 start_codon:yes stop_codon:yes gene_type:complete